MLKLYELLAKVGTNPQLRAWAMKQIIKLRHLKKGYKDSFSHKMDKDRAKNIIDPFWSTKQFLKDQNFNLKTKVVPIDQAKKTINIRKIGRQSDKDKFYGVTGQATTAVNRVRQGIDDFWKKHALEDKWFDKTMKKHLKGDKKATKALDQDRAIYEYEKWLKEKDKVVPFWPRKKSFKKPPGKAEGGSASLENGGNVQLASAPDGEPFMMEEFLDAIKQGFKGTYDEYIDKIDRRPSDYLAKGGRIGFKKGTKKGGIGDLMGELYRLFNIGPLLGSPELIDLIQKIPFEKGGRAGFDEGGSTQKEIDKALAAIEKLKPGLMPESYEALIQIYKDKQKELDTGIMESAGGLGEMLGEGGRAGFQGGGTSIRKYEIPPKVLPLIEEMYEKAGGRGQTGLSLKEFAFQYFNKAKGGRIGFKEGSKEKGIGSILTDFLANIGWEGTAEDLRQEREMGWYLFPELADIFYPKHIYGGDKERLSRYKKHMKGVHLGLKPKEKAWKKYKKWMEMENFERANQAKGGRIGFQRAGSVPYLSRGWSQPGVYKSWRGAEMLEALPGLASLMSKYKPPGIGHNKPPSPIEETKPPKKEPPKGEGIMSEIVATKLLEDLVDVEERKWDSKTGKETSTWKTYRRSDKTRPPTEEEIEYDYPELWNEEQSPWDFGSTIEELDAAVEDAKAYERQMYDDYKTGKLDKYMSMDAKLERVLDADSADRPSGYDPDEEEEIRAYGDEKDRIAIAKMNEAEEIARGKASGSPWYTDPKIPSPEEELRKEFPGLDDKTIRNILADKDPERVANVKESLRKALKMKMQGKDTDEILKTLRKEYPKKKAAGGPVGYPPEVYGPPVPKKTPLPIPLPPTDEPSPRPNPQKFRDPHWQYDIRFPAEEKPGKIVDPREGIGLDAFGDIDVDLSDPRFQFGLYNPEEDYHPWEFEVGKGSIGAQWKKKFKKKPKILGKAHGGIARRPNAVPPLSGPTPQGLTYLLGDDIVKNRIT